MLFKVQNFFNLNSRLPLLQGSITSLKYFDVKFTGNSSMYMFVTKFLPEDFEVTLYLCTSKYILNCLQGRKWLP